MRYPVALLIAAAVAAFLFLMMRGWVETPPGPLATPEPAPTVAVQPPPPTPPPRRSQARPQPPSVVPPPQGSNIRVSFHTDPQPRQPTLQPLQMPTTIAVREQPGSWQGGALDGGPVRTSAVAPLYPRAARQAGQEGWVELAFTVTARGEVRDVEVISASPRGVFDRAAIRAVQRWRFRPAREAGQARAVRVRQTVRFELSQDGGGGSL